VFVPRPLWLALGAVATALLAADLGRASGAATGVAMLLGTAALLALVPLVRRGSPRAALLLLGTGTVCVRLALGALLAGPAATVPAPPLEAGEWQGTVASVSSPSRSEQRAMLRLGERVSPDPATGPWVVYAWLPRFPPIVPGDHVLVRGEVEPVPSDGEGFASFLASRGAVGTLRARSVSLVAPAEGPLAEVERLRRAIDAALARGLPEPEAGLAAGILVGLRERVGRDVADDFTATGLSHVVAISGWNIAIVAGVAGSLLASAGLGRRSRSWAIVVAILAYTLLAGGGASVVRAAAMGGIAIILRERGRPADAIAALGVACWGLLLLDPAMAADIGFQLSVAATVGLLAFAAPLGARLGRLLGPRAPRWLVETLGVSLAAQAATLPLILLHFGRLSVVSPAANLLVAPVVAPAMLGALVGAILGVVAEPLPDLVAALPTLLAWLPLAAMVRVADVFASLPFASLELPDAVALGGAGATAAALLLALRHSPGGDRAGDRPSPPSPRAGRRAAPGAWAGRPRARLGVALVALLMSLPVLVVVARPPAALRVTVLDVGQGDAILLEGIEGGRLLVDGGPDPDLLVRRLDERIPAWDRRIDLAVLTHPHEDHAAGLAGLPTRYRVGAVAENGMLGRGPGHVALRDTARSLGIPSVRLAQGDHIELDGASVRVVWPPRGSVPATSPDSGRRINGTSIVLAVTFGSQRLLLTGDIEDDLDAALLEVLGPGGPPWDLLKVAHHGSATASSEPLLAALRPRTAVVSAGEDNTYGHPSPEALARLAEAGARIFRTDRHGSVTVMLDGQTRQVATDRSRRPSALAWRPRPRPFTGCPGNGVVNGEPGAPRPPACYAPADGRTHEDRSGLPPARAVAHAAAGAARHGRRRDLLLPRASARRPGDGPRPPPRGDGGPSARCRQGSAPDTPAGAPGSRTRGRALARRAGPSGAVARGGRTPRHAADRAVRG
jgi:competence protein ComEC